MFIFVLVTSIVFLVLAAIGGLWSYLAFKSDETSGDATAYIGFMVGMALGAISIAFGIVGLIGVIILANRVWG